MNKYELIEELLERAEALEESAGRNGVARRYRDAHLKTMNDELSKYIEKEKNEGLTRNECEKVHNLMMNMSYVKNSNSENDISMPESKFFGRAAAKNPHNRIGNIKLGKDAAEYSKAISDGRSGNGSDIGSPSALRKYDGIGRYDRTKKSQNECVADLLIEAAQLLYDSEE